MVCRLIPTVATLQLLEQAINSGFSWEAIDSIYRASRLTDLFSLGQWVYMRALSIQQAPVFIQLLTAASIVTAYGYSQTT